MAGERERERERIREREREREGVGWQEREREEILQFLSKRSIYVTRPIILRSREIL